MTDDDNFNRQHRSIILYTSNISCVDTNQCHFGEIENFQRSPVSFAQIQITVHQNPGAPIFKCDAGCHLIADRWPLTTESFPSLETLITVFAHSAVRGFRAPRLCLLLLLRSNLMTLKWPSKRSASQCTESPAQEHQRECRQGLLKKAEWHVQHFYIKRPQRGGLVRMCVLCVCVCVCVSVCVCMTEVEEVLVQQEQQPTRTGAAQWVNLAPWSLERRLERRLKRCLKRCWHPCI